MQLTIKDALIDGTWISVVAIGGGTSALGLIIIFLTILIETYKNLGGVVGNQPISPEIFLLIFLGSMVGIFFSFIISQSPPKGINDRLEQVEKRFKEECFF